MMLAKQIIKGVDSRLLRSKAMRCIQMKSEPLLITWV